MRFKLFGTEIYISFLFFAVMLFMLLFDRTGLCPMVVLSALLHETGHLFAMWAVGCEPKSVRIVPASISITRGFSLKKWGGVFIDLAGPLTNLMFFFGFYGAYLFNKSETVYNFALINFAVFIFNMLPFCGLDGGALTVAVLGKILRSTDKAERTLRIITVISGTVFMCVGITMLFGDEKNISVLIVALYLIISAIIKV